jgi:hypothetical protein
MSFWEGGYYYQKVLLDDYFNRAVLKEGIVDKTWAVYQVFGACLQTMYIEMSKEYCIDNTTDLNGEEWRQIQGTSGKYFVSNYGRVKSLCKYSAIILKQYQKSNGYYVVRINGKNTMVHRLVALAFGYNEYTG